MERGAAEPLNPKLPISELRQRELDASSPKSG